jgi:hypothetical protein
MDSSRYGCVAPTVLSANAWLPLHTAGLGVGAQELPRTILQLPLLRVPKVQSRSVGAERSGD